MFDRDAKFVYVVTHRCNDENLHEGRRVGSASGQTQRESMSSKN